MASLPDNVVRAISEGITEGLRVCGILDDEATDTDRHGRRYEFRRTIVVTGVMSFMTSR